MVVAAVVAVMEVEMVVVENLALVVCVVAAAAKLFKKVARGAVGGA